MPVPTCWRCVQPRPTVRCVYCCVQRRPQKRPWRPDEEVQCVSCPVLPINETDRGAAQHLVNQSIVAYSATFSTAVAGTVGSRHSCTAQCSSASTPAPPFLTVSLPRRNFAGNAPYGSSALNRGHEHQRTTRRCSAREGRPRCVGGAQRGGGTGNDSNSWMVQQ